MVRPGRDSTEVTRSRPGRVRVSLPNSRLKARRDSAEVTRSRRGPVGTHYSYGEVTCEETNNSLLGEGVRLRTMAAPDQRRDGVTHYSYGEGEGPPPST